jgi:predicted nucleic acid-binding protein
MIDKCFIDTNILVYGYIDKEADKHKAALKLFEHLGNIPVFISTQVLSEFYSVLSKNRIDGGLIKKHIFDIAEKTNIAVITFETITLCLELKEKYGFSYWDSLILATAIESGCKILYTEDLKHNQVINNCIKIINPISGIY